MSDAILKVENLGKKYYLRHQQSGRYTALRDVLAGSVRSFGRKLLPGGTDSKTLKREEFWALKDVSFEVNRGEAIGIIGRNGAGKSTLLKVLSRITKPTTGRVAMKGRVASLLEVGTGFHPELTGRENIYLNGAILGMTRADIKRRFDEIVDFAEVEKFLDTPVKRYSSGMYVRLAFAVAAHLEPEILVVDEVLAVGDTAFQKKCLGKMEEVSRTEGRTVLFVSHNTGTIATLCNRTILLNKGNIIFMGDTGEAIRQYHQNTNILSASLDISNQSTKRSGDGKAKFVSARLLDLRENETPVVYEYEPFSMELTVEVKEEVEVSIISITIIDPFNNDLYTTIHYDNLSIDKLQKGKYSFKVHFNPNFLSRGTYNIRLACFGPVYHEYDHIREAFSIIVAQNEIEDLDAYGRRPGTVNLKMPWSFDYVPIETFFDLASH